MIKCEEKYIKLLDLRKKFYIFWFISPLVLGLISVELNENFVFIFIGLYLFVFSLWGLRLYYSSCPNCDGLFFGVRHKDDESFINFRIFKFFINNRCNQCGFPDNKASS